MAFQSSTPSVHPIIQHLSIPLPGPSSSVCPICKHHCHTGPIHRALLVNCVVGISCCGMADCGCPVGFTCCTYSTVVRGGVVNNNTRPPLTWATHKESEHSINIIIQEPSTAFCPSTIIIIMCQETLHSRGEEQPLDESTS